MPEQYLGPPSTLSPHDSDFGDFEDYFEGSVVTSEIIAHDQDPLE